MAPSSRLIDRAAFVARLAQELPEVDARIDEGVRGLLHFEMSSLASATCAALEARDWPTVRRYLTFVDRIHARAAPDVDNAVYVSFMEHLPLWGDEADPPELRELLPVGLAGILWDMEGREFEWPPTPRPE